MMNIQRKPGKSITQKLEKVTETTKKINTFLLFQDEIDEAGAGGTIVNLLKLKALVR